MSEQKPIITVPNDEFFAHLTSILEEGERVTFVVKGCSMFPFLKNGKDVVCLERYDGKGLRRGDVVLFRYRGKHILHRICRVRIADGTRRYEIRGDGNISGREYAVDGTVCGVMTKRISPEGKEWSCGSWSWRFWSQVWMSLRPVRRYLLAVLRRLSA